MEPVTLPPTLPVTAAAVGVAAVAAVVTLVFMVAVRSPFVGAFVRLVTVVIVPAVILVGLATELGKVTTAAAVTVCPASWSVFAVTRAVTDPTAPVTEPTAPDTEATAWLVLMVVPDRLPEAVGAPMFD